MKLNTRDFGEIEIEEKDIVTNARPIYFIQQYRSFDLLYR